MRKGMFFFFLPVLALGFYFFQPKPAPSPQQLARPLEVKAFFPSGMQVMPIVDGKALSKDALFALNEIGQPTVCKQGTFFTFKSDEKNEPIPPFKVVSADQVDAYTWTRNGVLLMVVGQELGVLTQGGFSKVVNLPSLHMKLEPAGEDACYLYGGATPEQQRQLYLYRRDGKLLNLLEAANPISAVTGNGTVTFFASGNSIFLLEGGAATIIVYKADAQVQALAVYPKTAGIIYATEHGVGYVYEKGESVMLLKGRTGIPKIHGENLFLYFKDFGISRCFPISRLESLEPEHELVFME